MLNLETHKTQKSQRKAKRYSVVRNQNFSLHQKYAVSLISKSALTKAGQLIIGIIHSLIDTVALRSEVKPAELRIHVKQDANRRIPPGRDPGSGGAW